MYFNALLVMYGLNPDDFVQNADFIIEDENKKKEILLDEKPTVRICKECGHRCYVHGRYLTKKRFHPGTNFEVIFLINRIQYQCDYCKKTYVFDLKGIADKYRNISFNQAGLYNDFKESLTFNYIAKKNGLSKARIIQLFDEMFPNIEAYALPRILCIDEIRCMGHQNSPYACVLMNFETSEAIDLIGSRTKEYLDNYFSLISSEELSKVKFIISDMFDGYKRVASRYFPNAHHVVDRFHVIQLLSRAVNRIRTQVMKSFLNNEIEYKFMKTHWKLFLMSKYKIPNKLYRCQSLNCEYHFDDLIFRCLHLDNRFLIAWGAYQELLNVPWGKETYRESENRLDRIINTLISSNIEELVRVGETFKQFRTSILMGMAKNQLNFKLTNGRIECLNNHIKTIKKDAYGYQNFIRFRKRVLLVLRNRKHLSN